MNLDIRPRPEKSELKFKQFLIEKGREDILLVFLSLLGGIIFDYLFYGAAIGISYPIFVAVFYSLFFGILAKSGTFKPGNTLILLLPVFLLSLTFFLFSNSFLATLNFFIIPALIISQTILLTGKNCYQWHQLQFIRDILLNGINRTIRNIFKPVTIAFLTLKIYFPELSSEKYSTIKKIGVGLIFSAPVLFVVIFLLASADNIFYLSVNNLGLLIGQIKPASFFPHLILISTIGLLLSGYIWSLLNPPGENKKVYSPGVHTTVRWDPVITSTVLLSIDLIYILFCLIQFSYLFGGAANNSLNNFSYSEYARNGFFELIVVTIINLSILVGSINFVKTDNRLTKNIVGGLLSILVISTAIILYSAHFRMSLYEAAFGYTYLRLYVHIFMLMLFTWFIIAFFRVWSNPFRLVKMFLISALAFYTLLNYLNVDNIIAGKNVERFIKTNNIDIIYLEDLSYDAIPHLIYLTTISKNPQLNLSIRNFLTEKKLELSPEKPWQSYNLSRERARGLLLNR